MRNETKDFQHLRMRALVYVFEHNKNPIFIWLFEAPHQGYSCRLVHMWKCHYRALQQQKQRSQHLPTNTSSTDRVWLTWTGMLGCLGHLSGVYVSHSGTSACSPGASQSACDLIKHFKEHVQWELLVYKHIQHSTNSIHIKARWITDQAQSWMPASPLKEHGAFPTGPPDKRDWSITPCWAFLPHLCHAVRTPQLCFLLIFG